MSETTPEMTPEAINPGRMLIVGEGVLPSWDEETILLTTVSRQRFSAAGHYYQMNLEAFDEEGAVIVIGDSIERPDDFPANLESKLPAGFKEQFDKTYGIPNELVEPVVATSNPFKLFEHIIEQDAFSGCEFTPAQPLVLAAGRSYGRQVLAPVARAAFGIADEDAVTILPAERTTVPRWIRHNQIKGIVGVTVCCRQIEPYNVEDLRVAGELYDKVKASRVGFFGRENSAKA